MFDFLPSSSPRSGKPFRLTRKNYFSPKRPHLSNSQISDYILSPSYFHRKHVLHDLEDEKPTPSMIRGMAVDAIVTGGKLPERLSEKMADEAADIANAVMGTPFFDDHRRSATFQPVLSGELEGLPVCGMPDMIVGDTQIIDLKVVSSLKVTSPSKWMMNSLDMGYVRQMAMYAYLLAGIDGMRDVDCFHLVAAPIRPGLVKVKAYRLPTEALTDALVEIRLALMQIKKNNYADPPLDDRAIEDLPYYRSGGDNGVTTASGITDGGEEGA